MPGYVSALGDCLLIPVGAKNHLCFVVCSPMLIHAYGATQQVIVVNATTIYENSPFDNACILDANCHPFITHASYIAYWDMHPKAVSHVSMMVDKGFWKQKPPCSQEVITKVIGGACASKAAANELKLALKCPGVIPRA